MGYVAAVARLAVLSVTGVNHNYIAVNQPPAEADLPVLLIQDATQPFVEGFASWDVAMNAGRFGAFVDHLLLISGAEVGMVTERQTAINLYVDRYLTAINGDMMLNDNLTKPLTLVVARRGVIVVGLARYSGIQFRHFWEINIT